MRDEPMGLAEEVFNLRQENIMAGTELQHARPNLLSAATNPLVKPGSVSCRLPGVAREPGSAQTGDFMRDAVGLFAAVLNPMALGVNPRAADDAFASLSMPPKKTKDFSKEGDRFKKELELLLTNARLGSSQPQLTQPTRHTPAAQTAQLAARTQHERGEN
jgi:hypothetical protein